MKRTMFSILKLSFLLLLIPFCFLCHYPCLAQETLISVDIYFLPEKIACKQGGIEKGYALYPQESNCDKWKWEPEGQIKRIQEYKIDMITNIPPESIQLSKDLYRLLSNYHNIDRTDVEDRCCILMVFTFHYKPETNIVTLERRVNNQYTEIPPYLPKKILTYELDGDHLIHHERADAFIPGDRITWRLTVGDKHWDLTTSKPQ